MSKPGPTTTATQAAKNPIDQHFDILHNQRQAVANAEAMVSKAQSELGLAKSKLKDLFSKAASANL